MKHAAKETYTPLVLSVIAGELAWKRADMWRGLGTYIDWANPKDGSAICNGFAQRWSVGPGITLEGLLDALLEEARVLTKHAAVLKAAARGKAKRRPAIPRRPRSIAPPKRRIAQRAA